MRLMGQTVPFFKMQGCGNDFVAIDNREVRVPESVMSAWAKKVCARAFGVAADGIFFLENAPKGSGLDYRWHFYNNDGSRAEMCGNASRCAAKLAHAVGLAPEEHVFGTDAGPIKAQVFTEGENAGLVRVQLTKPKKLTLNAALRFKDDEFTVHSVDTGVPHAVVLVKNAAAVDVQTIGSVIRFHEHFQPAGTNVNFVQVTGPDSLICRTYERGVEAETYACGTGAVASQVVANSLGLTGPEVKVTTSGGEILGVILEDGKPYLQGAATLVFTGTLNLDALGLSL
ncbi:diaminopimelate epimerase [Paucidesulfovibrio longus]|uniref:diaminopimelate epimerase n=1 Tax=Paucidesulfovibrio longus TaxID=889 RepID=UPI0003B5FE5E|nr:diaminopimelate epimerase [Paucidesulfovibrio longus]